MNIFEMVKQANIFEMAKQANIDSLLERNLLGEIIYMEFSCDVDGLKAFAELVAAAEREACAKVIESHGPFMANGAMLANAIRARGTT